LARQSEEQRARRESRLRRQPSADGTKVCLGCGEAKRLGEFVAINIRPGAFYPRCKQCRSARKQELARLRLSDAERERRELLAQRRSALEQLDKSCLACGKRKSITEFTALKYKLGATHPRCMDCRNAAARDRYQTSPEFRAAEIARATRNKRRRAGRIDQSDSHHHDA